MYKPVRQFCLEDLKAKGEVEDSIFLAFKLFGICSSLAGHENKSLVGKATNKSTFFWVTLDS